MLRGDHNSAKEMIEWLLVVLLDVSQWAAVLSGIASLMRWSLFHADPPEGVLL